MFKPMSPTWSPKSAAGPGGPSTLSGTTSNASGRDMFGSFKPLSIGTAPVSPGKNSPRSRLALSSSEALEPSTPAAVAPKAVDMTVLISTGSQILRETTALGHAKGQGLQDPITDLEVMEALRFFELGLAKLAEYRSRKGV